MIGLTKICSGVVVLSDLCNWSLYAHNSQLVFQLYSGNITSATVTHSMAVQLAFTLEAHTLSSSLSFENDNRETSSRTQNHLRSLFWICYTIDKELSFRTRQPPALCDEYCDLTVSADYLEVLFAELPFGVPSERPHPCRLFPSDIKLSIIKSRAFKLLYSASAVRGTDAELLMAIRKLDDDLETWRIAIPEELRPDISTHEISMGQMKLDMRALILRLEYHRCITVIHQTTCGGLAFETSPSILGTRIASSNRLAIEASRSSLRYMRIAHQVLDRGSFW